MRFWVINTNVDRKIASTDANVAKPTKVGSEIYPGRPSRAGENPKPKYQQMDVNEGHRPRESRNRFGQSLLACLLALLALAACD